MAIKIYNYLFYNNLQIFSYIMQFSPPVTPEPSESRGESAAYAMTERAKGAKDSPWEWMLLPSNLDYVYVYRHFYQNGRNEISQFYWLDRILHGVDNSH